MNNDLKFFTNEPERDLYSRFATILKSNTQFFDVLVGYFRASGFFKMYEPLETVEKIRILVGLNVDKFTIKIIDQATNEAKVAAISVADLIDNSVIDELNLEKDYLHTAYKGKDVGNGKLHDGGYMVFYPYRLDDKGKTICIPEKELQTAAPNIYAYLLERKDILLSREYFVKSSKAWFELWNPRKMQHFYRRKFVFSEIGLVNDFVLVDECFYTDSVCVSELKPEYRKYETFIHRYLNSKLATYVYKKVSVPKANGYSIYKNAFLKSMPIILPTDDIDFSNLTNAEFDAYIYQLVGLSDDEVNMVETAQFSQA